MYKDNKDQRSLRYMKYHDYDIMQHYIIKFKNENFEENLNFFKLYIYFIKVNIFFNKIILNFKRIYIL